MVPGRQSRVRTFFYLGHVLAINKMDLVGYKKEVFDSIIDDYAKFAAQAGITDITAIAVSALNGDNIIDKSEDDGDNGILFNNKFAALAL